MLHCLCKCSTCQQEVKAEKAQAHVEIQALERCLKGSLPELADEEDEAKLEGMLPCVPLSPKEALIQTIHMFKEDEDDHVFVVSLLTPPNSRLAVMMADTNLEELYRESFGFWLVQDKDAWSRAA